MTVPVGTICPSGTHKGGTYVIQQGPTGNRDLELLAFSTTSVKLAGTLDLSFNWALLSLQLPLAPTSEGRAGLSQHRRVMEMILWLSGSLCGTQQGHLWYSGPFGCSVL